MKLALIGYGRMGKEVEEAALSAGHSIDLIIDMDNTEDLTAANLKGIDAVIEFSGPDAAFGNVVTALEAGVPVVSGSTGWSDRYDEAAAVCRKQNGSFIHSSNFSIGVNILFRLNSELARLMSPHKSYKPSVEEIHHTRKLDAPSGTAISLVKGIAESNSNYHGWAFTGEEGEKQVPVKSKREGDVPGTHIVEWDSPIDRITLSHEARGRKGFAAGAVMAAEFIHTRKGVFTMSDVLGF